VFLPAGILANGATYVVANASSAAAIINVTNFQNSTVMNFNGDDAVELKYRGLTVDVIGQIGYDPGTAWGTDPNSTVNHTMLRINTVCCGDPIGSDVFVPTTQWTVLAVDTFTNLDSHLTNCAVAVEGESWGALKSQYR
jgi:uncharacterized protein